MEIEEKINDLLKELKRENDPEKRMNLLVELAYQHWFVCQYSKVLRYAEMASVIAKRLKDRKGLAASLFLCGVAHKFMNNYDKALELLLKSLKIHKELGLSDRIVEEYNNIGEIYYITKRFEPALDCFHKALDFREDYCRTFNNISATYFAMDDFKQSLLWGRKALEASEAPKYERSRIFALINIAASYKAMNDFEAGIPYIEEALTISENRGDDSYLVALKKAVYYYLSDSSYLEKCKKMLEKAIIIAKKQENKIHLLEIYNSYCKVYEYEKNYEKAYHFLKKFTELNEKIISEKMFAKISEMQEKYRIEKKELEAQKMCEKAAKLTSVSAMATGIIHQIAQPISAMNIETSSINYWIKENNILLPETLRNSFKNIHSSIQKINDLINHMKFFLKEDEFRQIEKINLNEAVQKTLELMESQISAHGIFLRLDFSEEDLFFRVNRLGFEQILINVLSNSIQSLDKKKDSNKWIEIATAKEKNTVILKVSDNGPGIPESLLERIFEPFYTDKKSTKNMGLGLTIVKDITEKFEGKVKACNNQNKGAVFEFTFSFKG